MQCVSPFARSQRTFLRSSRVPPENTISIAPSALPDTMKFFSAPRRKRSPFVGTHSEDMVRLSLPSQAKLTRPRRRNPRQSRPSRLPPIRTRANNPRNSGRSCRSEPLDNCDARGRFNTFAADFVEMLDLDSLDRFYPALLARPASWTEQHHSRSSLRCVFARLAKARADFGFRRRGCARDCPTEEYGMEPSWIRRAGMERG